jgi:hypothetical protein
MTMDLTELDHHDVTEGPDLLLLLLLGDRPDQNLRFWTTSDDFP